MAGQPDPSDALTLTRWRAAPDAAEQVRADVDAWARGVADSGLLEAFGGQVAVGEPLLDFLERFAAAHWDFRAGRERNLAAVPDLTAAQVQAIADAVGPLGLAGTPPPSLDRYDAVLMTGGMVRAGIVKPRHVRDLVDAGVGFDEVTFLGAFRPFAGDEVELARGLGVEGDDEFDAMVAGLEKSFGPFPHGEVSEYSDDSPFASWRDVRWKLDGLEVRAVAAPSSEPERRRAHTGDTFQFWAERIPSSIRSVLVVTTPVYVPYQAAVAVEVLGLEYGITVETVAVSDSANDLGPLTQQFLPHHQLQELRSAVRGMRSLAAALDDRFIPS